MNLIRLKLFSILTTAFLLTFSLSAQTQNEDIIIATMINDDLTIFQNLEFFIEDLSEKTGLPFALKYVPPKRSLELVNNCEIDGDLGRIDGFQTIYPNIVHTFEPSGFVTYYLYSMKSIPENISFESIKNNYISIPLGAKVIEKNIKNPAEKIIYYSNMKVSPLDLLIENRVDYIFLPESLFKEIITKMEIDPKIFYRSTQPLIKEPLYMYMNKKHFKLIPIIDKALHKMKQEGTLEHYFL